MRYIFKRQVTEWYAVEAQTKDDAEDRFYAGWADVVNQDESDLIFVEIEGEKV